MTETTFSYPNWSDLTIAEMIRIYLYRQDTIPEKYSDRIVDPGSTARIAISAQSGGRWPSTRFRGSLIHDSTLG